MARSQTSPTDDQVSSRRRFLRGVGRVGASLVGAGAATSALASTSDAASMPSMGSFPAGVTVNDGVSGAAVHQMALVTRTDPGLTWPIAVLRPGPAVSGNSQSSLDIMPSGSGWNLTNPSSNGVTWIDCCDADVQSSNGGTVGTARLACFSDHIELRSTAYSGAEPKSVWIVSGMGSTPHICVQTDGAVVTNSLQPQPNAAWTIYPGYSNWTPLVVAGASGQSADLFGAFLSVDGLRAFSISPGGVPHWGNNNGQTTVGAAGGASALPARPSRFLNVIGDDGKNYVIPAYAR